MKLSLAGLLMGAFVSAACHAQTNTDSGCPQASAPPPLTGASAAQTNSLRYQWLESDSISRQDFITRQNCLTKQMVMQSPNLDGIQNYFTLMYNRVTVMASYPLDATHTLKIVDRGMEQTTDLVLNDGTKDQVLFSSFSLNKKIDDSVFESGISPDHKAVYLMIAQDGSIDQMTVLIYDLANQKLLDTRLSLASDNIAWISSSSLVFDQALPDGTSHFAKVDLPSQQISALGTEGIGGFVLDKRLGYALYLIDNYYVLHNQLDQSELIIDPSTRVQSIAAVTDTDYFLYCRGPNGRGEIRHFTKPANPSSVAAAPAVPTPVLGEVLIAETDLPVTSATAVGTNLALAYRNGPDRFIDLYDFTGKKQGEIPVPDCCSVRGLLSQSGSVIQLGLQSAVVASGVFNYDLQKNSWDKDPDATMLKADELSYVTEVNFATSDDGTAIPVRITRRADLVQDKSHPVFFYSYGGFDLAGRFDPVFNAPSFEFLKRGGILADPALRGGNEYGAPWWKAALLSNKIKTYQDLNAAARMMVQERWTVPQKISSTGTSNGGLTVAAAALLSPGTFGLVIPISGVHDMLARDTMDARDGGWDSEFGSDTDPAMIPFLTAISPLENASKQGSSHFLIIDGLADSRVNSAHSLKLAAALEDLGGTPGNVNLLSVKNEGHWVEAFRYANKKAWKVDVAIWTSIFDQGGLTW